jgi:hypothetical protein
LASELNIEKLKSLTVVIDVSDLFIKPGDLAEGRICDLVVAMVLLVSGAT